MRGNYSLSPTFDSLGIRRPQVLLIQPLVIWDHKRLHLHDKSVQWESKAIINVTYSKHYGVLMVLCQDWNLYIFTESLELLTKVKWESKYTVCFRLVEQISAFLMVGVGEIELCKVSINCNVRQTKFLSSMRCDIIKLNLLQADDKTKLKWHKGCDYLIKENLLYAWSLQDINFYRLNTLELFARMDNITKKEIPLTKVFFNSFYRYVIVGYINGQIRVWKLPDRTATEPSGGSDHRPFDRKEIIHTYTFHSKSICNIIKAQDPRQFISQSVDQRIALWNLDTFELLYTYDFLGEYENIWLYDYRRFYATIDDTIGSCEFGCRLEFVCNINSNITYFDKHYKQPTLYQQLEAPQSIQFTLNNNLGLKIDSADLTKPDVNKANIQYFYPPLKSKSILQIIECPFESGRFYFLVESGEVYKSRIEANSGKIESSYHIDKLMDEEQHQLNQTASIIKFLRIVPPCFDSEIIGKMYSNDVQSKSSNDHSEAYLKKELMAVGCSKGAIVFVQRHSMEHIHTRITYHRESILMLESAYCEATKQPFLLSVCAEMQFKVVRFDEEKAICLRSISFLNNVQFFKTCLDRVFCVHPKGLFEVFKIHAEGELYCPDNNESNDHEENIVSMDFDESRKIVATAALDQRVKIWNFSKLLLLQITSNQPIESLLMVNGVDVLIAHSKKLSLLRIKQFGLSQEDFEKLSQEEHQETSDMIELTQHLLRARSKKRSDTFIDSPTKSIKPPTLTALPVSEPQIRLQEPPTVASNTHLKNVNVRHTRRSAPHRRQEVEKPSRKPIIIESADREDLRIVDQHMREVNEIRKSNATQFPKINGEKQSLFDEFMKAKLLNKKILTRRDITLNRIIMKNIIREYIGADIVEGLNGVKVDM